MRHWHRLLLASLVEGVLALALALALGTRGGHHSLAQPVWIIYVDAGATGGNNGFSWTDAYTELQPALTAASSGGEIWVAAGTYKPSVEHGGSGSRYRSFQLGNGVALYGGFAGTETSRDQRDWLLHKTILSGDIGQVGVASDNSYHVFYHPPELALDGTALLDGFTITGGNADQFSSPLMEGGGMYNDSASPSLYNCTFSGNSASLGGAIYNVNSSPVLMNCVVSDNLALINGGGIYNSSSSPRLSGCTVSGNSADYVGGGIYSWLSSPELSNCAVSANSAVSGGGMANESSSPALFDCTFAGNSAGEGGGGGGMSNRQSAPVLTNCIFEGNSVGEGGGGGGIFSYQSSPTLTNCTFWGNSGGEYAGGGFGGGAMYNNTSDPVLTNCILWGDGPDEIVNNSSSSPLVSYSDIQGGCEADPYNNCGDGNVNTVPGFLGAAGGDFHLGPGSPCIDAGNNAAPNLPAHDFEGDPRLLDGDGDGTATVDMGADEKQLYYYVDVGATGGAKNGYTWADAFTDLQDALAAARPGGEIWVAEGTYSPSVEHGGSGDPYRSFQMKNGVALYGGFAGTETRRDQRDWLLHETILSGDLGQSRAASGSSYHVFYHPPELALNSTAVLDGFTISGGSASGTAPHDAGGGMHNKGSSPSLINLLFSGNSAGRGGGIYNEGSSPSLANLVLSGNSAGWGGGLYNRSSSPLMANCTLWGNIATSYGGGIYNYLSSSPTLTNCSFSGNLASVGAGIYNDQSSPGLTNCIFWGEGGDEITNSLVGSSPVISYSDIQGGCEAISYSVCGAGNLALDPRFVDASHGDLHLQAGSPCVDAGSNAAPNLPAHDFEGDPRLLDGDGDGTATVDMGVDEVRLRLWLPLVLRSH